MTASTTRPSAGHQYLDDVLELLWPGHQRTSRPGSRGLVKLPPGQPRLLLPRRPNRVAAAALRNYNTAAVGVRAGRIALGAAALRCGIGSLMADGLVRGEVAIEDELAARLGHEVFVGVYIGPPRVAQKPVLQVLDRQGNTRAFAKISVNEHTAGLVEHEIETLRSLAALDLTLLRVPRILHEGHWHGHRLLVQEAIANRRCAPAVDSVRASASRELFESWGSWRRPIADSAFAGRVLERVRALPDNRLAGRLREAVGAAVEWTGRTELAFGAAHGDWVPWNMTAQGARLDVWDWEGFAADVPFGFDELHWRVNQAVVIDGQHPLGGVPAVTGAAGAFLGRAGMDEEEARATALWYVLDLATRYAAEGEDVIGGTRLSRLDAWAVPALVTLLRAVMPSSLR